MIFLGVFVLVVVILLALAAFISRPLPATTPVVDAGNIDLTGTSTTVNLSATSSASTASSAPTSLVVTDEVVGTGAVAKSGMSVTVQYTGTLASGKKFDSSYDHGQPFTFTLGAGEVIKGWDQGVAGMKVGGKRKLVIPPSLGYGAQDVGGGLIPPNSTLTFEVELVGVK